MLPVSGAGNKKFAGEAEEPFVNDNLVPTSHYSFLELKSICKSHTDNDVAVGVVRT
jgi:hypothetical protein